jgi:hypothetical protein
MNSGGFAVYDFLGAARSEIQLGDWAAFEARASTLATALVPQGELAAIWHFPLVQYESALASMIDEGEALADEGIQALYFEFDMDNDWRSALFLCRDFSPVDAHDDEWASVWERWVAGPSLPHFAELMATEGFSGSPRADAMTTLLVARTEASFGRAYHRTRRQFPAACAFHDQAPITYLQR